METKKQYEVVHVEKHTSITSGLDRHLRRREYVVIDGQTKEVQWVPDNADPERTKDNVELLDLHLTPQEAVMKRIREAGVKPKKGQNTCLECIISGSHETLCAMKRDELLRWANDSLEWARKQWGKDNVVAAYLHVDETTPHLHIIIVPLVYGISPRTIRHREDKKKKGKTIKTRNLDAQKMRLSASDVYNTRRLYTYHDSYASEVGAKYGLKRGIKAESGSRKRHQKSIDYNRKLGREAKELQGQIDELKGAVRESRKREIEAKKAASRQEIISNAADVGARVLGSFGKGAIAQANKERDDALKRAEEAERTAEVERKKAEYAKRKEKQAIESAKAAVEEKEEYARKKAQSAYNLGLKEGAKVAIPLRAEIDDLQKKLEKSSTQCENQKKSMQIAVKVNPSMINYPENVRDMLNAGMSWLDIQEVYMKGRKEGVSISIKHNGEAYDFPTMVELAKSTKGEMRVWFNRKRLSVFVDECKSKIREKNPKISDGIPLLFPSMETPKKRPPKKQ